MRWVKTETRLPTESDWYLTWDGEIVDRTWFWAQYREFDDSSGEQFVPLQWAKWPKPPKE